MNFSFDKFLKPLTSSDKNIKIYDNNNVVKYIINPFNVKTLNISNNLITINLESGRNIVLDFSTQNETKQAIQKLQIYVDTLKNSLVPYYIQHAVELEAPNFTKGPTGSTGAIGPIGPDGQKGDDGKSAYDVWLLSNSGTQQDFLTSLTGPIGPTGPMAFGNTDELLVTGQTINATVDNKDIEIVTKGAGNLLFKIDRDGWLLNYGIKSNNVGEVWGSGSTLDDDGYIYTTGGDYTSFNTYIIKTGTNGQVVWQKEINFYSSGECIIFQNGHLYLLVSDNSSYLSFGNMSILKINTDGFIMDQWLFDLPSTTIPYGYEIAVDEDDNVYYTGLQQNGSNSYDLIMGKLNTTTSNIDWSYVVDGGLSFDDRGYSIKYKNNYVYIVGTVINEQSFIPRGDIFVAKYDKLGNKVWAKVIGSADTYQEGLCITVDADNFIYIGGYINFDSTPGAQPIGPFNNFFIKLDLNGNNVWTKSINSFNRSIISIEEDGADHLFIVSTQASTSTPARVSTDLYLSKINKSNGSIFWQQYVGSPYRDSAWANIPDMYAAGHRTLVVDNIGKAVYVTGLTKEGGNLYHNAFLMSYDQKSLPDGPYGNWVIQTATFSTVTSTFDYYNDTFNIPSITITNTLLDNTTQTVSIITGNTSSTINKDKEVTLFSPNTELYVKGIVTIDDLYTLPRKAGTTGQMLTYGESGSLLEWKLPTISLTFNDIETIQNHIVGSASMSIYNDPIMGPVDGNFDDETFEVILPFDVNFMGETYSTVYVNSNSFVTFGGVFSGLSGFTEKNPPYPGIFIDAGDRSVQRLYTKTTASQFIVRYEGNVLPSGTASRVQIEWEMTFNENSSELSVNIGTNEAYGTGFSVIKDTNVINTAIDTAPNSSFKIIKGYGLRKVQANRLNYLNIEGLSYSVVEDPLNLGDDIVSIDFSGLGGAGKFYYQSTAPNPDTLAGIQPGTLWYDSEQGYLYVYVNDGDTSQWVTQYSMIGPSGPKGSDGNFTTLSSTYSNIFLDDDSDFHILAGIQNGADQSVSTLESFGSDQGMYLQAEIPVIQNDQDQIRFGIKDSNGDWVYHVKLAHNTPTIGQMVIYDSYGNDINNNVLDYSQTYVAGDILSIYIDGEKVYYKINGVTLVDGLTDFVVTNPSLSYRFFCETFVGTNPANTLSIDYSFHNFKFYPQPSVTKRKNLLSTTTKTADYVVTLNDYTIRVDATGNDVTITLPTVASSYSNGRGYEFIIKRVDDSGNNVYVNGDSGELIDIYTTNGLTLSSLEKVRVQSNGTNWDIL
jgi:hypothetical protein